jgi:hypothetical protein
MKLSTEYYGYNTTYKIFLEKLFRVVWVYYGFMRTTGGAHRTKERHMNSLMSMFIFVVVVVGIATIAWIIDGYLTGEDK